MRLAKLLIAALMVWSLYWAAAAWGLRSSIAAWFAEQERRGWQAEFSALETSGYPIRHLTRISRPALADPGTGTAWRADWLDLASPAVWPGKLDLHFPASAQRLSYFDQTAVITIASYADWNGPTTPGSYSLDGINYADCGLCLLIAADCNGESCAKTFYADAGDCTELGTRWLVMHGPKQGFGPVERISIEPGARAHSMQEPG